MGLTHWVAMIFCTLIIVEGLTLATFPKQIQSLLAEADPQWLQLAGMIEALTAFGLMTAALL